MANTIPRTARKAYADLQAAKILYAALFTNNTGYDPVAATNTYTTFAASATEVSSAGTGYTTGGVALTGLTPANIGATNVARVTANATTITSANFSFRYIVIYNHASPYNIEGVIDMGATYTVTAGTLTLTYDATNGLLNIA